MYSIYVLICPITKNVRYVGRTNDKLYNRLAGHCNGGSYNKKKMQWISMLKVVNKKPIIKSIEVVNTEKLSKTRELYWIKFFDGLGLKLFNVSGLTRKHS